MNDPACARCGKPAEVICMPPLCCACYDVYIMEQRKDTNEVMRAQREQPSPVGDSYHASTVGIGQALMLPDMGMIPYLCFTIRDGERMRVQLDGSIEVSTDEGRTFTPITDAEAGAFLRRLAAAVKKERGL